MASFYNLINAERVETFLKDLEAANMGEAFHERDRLLQCIHMLIWLHSSRPGSTAGAYAFGGLMDAIGIERWQFRKEPEADKAAVESRAGSDAAAGHRVELDPDLAKLFLAIPPSREAVKVPEEDWHPHHRPDSVGTPQEMVDSAEERVMSESEALEIRNMALLEALRPFAKFSRNSPDLPDDTFLTVHGSGCRITAGDCHAARKAAEQDPLR